MSIVYSVIGILICGMLGGIAAWALVAALGLDGVTGSIVSAVVGMAAAFVLWVATTSLLRALGWIR
jgi:hypothetical protein